MTLKDAAKDPVAKYLADYQAPNFIIKSVNMTFELFEVHTLVTSVMQINIEEGVDTIHLDGGPDIELVSIAVDDKALTDKDYSIINDDMMLRVAGRGFKLAIVTRLKPHANTRLEGLYQSSGNFCTQCEAEGFRHITYYPDRPDVMSTFYVRIEADKDSCPILLSNGNPSHSGDLKDGRHYAEWDDPFPKPSYLFALVAGDLGKLSDDFVTASGRKVELNIFAAQDDLDKCHYAMGALKRSMKWDEDSFGLEYDLDVYNIVAVSDFNMGAMENKGLNVFNTKYVLASTKTATDQDFDYIEGIIGHEYFHNWTGNRVTCRDWFQLSLKEGLTVFRDQEFSSDMSSRAIKRIDDVRALRAAQFPEDSGSLAHSVRPEKYIEINNFYTATIYNKGAEVIRMMHNLIGKDAFRTGMDIYFDRHDGQAVTCEDFVCAMEAGSGVDLGQFRLWYSQAGTPKVTVTRSYDKEAKQLTLTVKQHTPDTPGQSDKKPFHFPLAMGLLSKTGEVYACDDQKIKGMKASPEGLVIDVTEPSQDFTFNNVPEGLIPSLLRGFSAPIILENDLSQSELIILLNHDIDAFSRWEAAQTLAIQEILTLAADIQNGKEAVPDPTIISGFSGLLNRAFEDPALTAELLELPSENTIAEFMDVVDVDAIHAARGCLQSAITRLMADSLILTCEKCVSEIASEAENAKALRRLKNILLSYLAVDKSDELEEIISDHYMVAQNMTEILGALKVALFNNLSSSQKLLADFYDKWKNDTLVIDKWFMLQAINPSKGSVSKILSLKEHPDFSITNPNRMRSLVSAFTAANPVNFHDESGKGYDFLVEVIKELNSLNPQVAARLLAPLGRWSRFDGKRQQLMKNALREILSIESISPDVFELATKSLNE